VSSHEENALELHGAWLHAEISLQHMIEPTQALLSASWLCSTVRFGRLQTQSSGHTARGWENHGRSLASATCDGFAFTFLADATGVGAEERTGTYTRFGGCGEEKY
jgi:hypothetical protein